MLASLNLKKWHQIILLFCIVTIVIATVPIIKSFILIKEESFFTLAILGEDGLTELYFRDNNSTTSLGDEFHWTLFFLNHIGDTQYVSLRVKLLNSTNLPIYSTGEPSSTVQTIYEYRHVFMDNEELTHPFSWSYNDISEENGTLHLRKISVNNIPIQINVVSADSQLRLIFELWRFNEDINEFQPIWVLKDTKILIWNQIWFTVTND